MLKRVVGVLGVLAGDAISAVFALIPLGVLWLVLLQIKADTIGPAQHILDSDEPAGYMSFFGIVLLAVVLLPAILMNMWAGAWSGWSPRTRWIVAALVVLGLFTVSVTSNGIWNFFMSKLIR